MPPRYERIQGQVDLAFSSAHCDLSQKLKLDTLIAAGREEEELASLRATVGFLDHTLKVDCVKFLDPRFILSTLREEFVSAQERDDLDQCRVIIQDQIKLFKAEMAYLESRKNPVERLLSRFRKFFVGEM